jgi:hypothetical protein
MKALVSYFTGKVMVNCKQGASRSATLVLAFLMIKRHLTVQDAVRTVRAKREIAPNPGFLQQLCDLNEKLKSNKFFHNFHLSESSFSCPGLRASRLARRLHRWYTSQSLLKPLTLCIFKMS